MLPQWLRIEEAKAKLAGCKTLGLKETPIPNVLRRLRALVDGWAEP